MKKWFVSCALVTGFIFGLGVTAEAATWFVASNGNDSNACTSSSSPCLSVNGAYQKSAAGDTIQLAAGTYGAQTVNTRGALSSFVTAQPASGATVTLGKITVNGANHLEFRGMIAAGIFVQPNSAFITFRDIDMTSGDLFYLGGHDISFIGGDVGPAVDYHPQIAPSSGWEAGGGTNFLFDGVYFHDVTCTDCSAHHVECLQVAGAKSMVIRNSKFQRCGIFDLSFTSYNGAGSNSNVLIENNWFDTAVNGGYFSVHFSAMQNGTVRFNSSPQAMFVDTTVANSGTLNIVGNNVVGGILDGNSGGCLGASMAGSYSYNVTQGQKCGSTDINAAPGFVNAGAFDLRLAAGSSALNVVPTSTTAPTKDIMGTARPQGSGFDAGAFEMSSGSTGPAPASGLQTSVR
jgi:hypothetical protein